ncbi:MAG TPA: GNAT family N-acetyltransferase [Gaiellales bacterium]|jgi:mycothiol synthase|nr:GNAT family N-acetyltransferase [Gaiellales bacterium]
MQLPPGYRLRAPVIEDGPAIADMVNEETMALMGVPLASVEWVTTAWTAPGARLDRDFGVITDNDGTIVGYFLIEFEPPHTAVSVIGAVALSHHNRGIGSAIIQEVERRGRELAAGHENVILRMGALAGEPRVAALLTAHGFREVRVFWSMSLRFDGPPPPPTEVAGIDVRTLVRGQELEVYRCAAEAFEDHWGDGFSSEESWLHRHVDASDSFDPELWFLAWRGDRLVGLLLANADAEEDPELGYVGLLGVRREARGRGIGEALLRRSFVRFYELGKLGAQLVVDSESSTGADRLYERVGMTAQPRFSNWDRPLIPGS